ncbi:AraC family transcriptional regulator [Limoniibacter endophyticus]|uniref:AraC family transcriptional regulator n=1 Tax=Limoniibacter endophyticus TaxID=1565040 RepID=A0A8J3DI29_9HYPH|nr:AraC family transcriptional regulator [Limoniibacter endophyticus]GHC69089.1 AraC family transcriptional regulator [Limoniibacter endophyticus]
MSVEIHLRSYPESIGLDAHGYAQFVLPISGTLDMEIGGRGGRLGKGLCAFVAPEAPHDQIGPCGNRSVIVDVPLNSFTPRVLETFSRQIYLPMDASTAHLCGYMAHLRERKAPGRTIADGWLSLLLDTLVPEKGTSAGKLDALLARLSREPFRAWSADEMAREMGMSASSLQRAFRAEVGKSPRAWLCDLKMQHVLRLIETTSLPLCEVALEAGFSDQTALTRAVRAATGITPAKLRRNA